MRGAQGLAVGIPVRWKTDHAQIVFAQETHVYGEKRIVRRTVGFAFESSQIK